MSSVLIAAGIGAAVSIGGTIFGASKAKRDRRRAEKKAKRSLLLGAGVSGKEINFKSMRHLDFQNFEL